MPVGRRRKSLAPRHPGGKIIQRTQREREPVKLDDKPTPEVVARRVAMFGKPPPENGEAQGELECPISILGDRLDSDQQNAARKALATYSRFTMAILPPRIVAGQLRDYVQGSSAMPALPEDLEEHKKEYETMRRAILREVKWRFRFNLEDPNAVHPSAIARKAWREVQALMHRQPTGNIYALRLGLDAIVLFYGLAMEAQVVSNRDVRLEAA
ncbi:MAG: hypothetical protein ABFD96_01220 [Armatimonadia bacterium]